MHAAVFFSCAFCLASSASVSSGNHHPQSAIGISPNGNFAIDVDDDARSSGDSVDDPRSASVSEFEARHAARMMREEKSAEVLPSNIRIKAIDDPKKAAARNFASYCIQFVIIMIFAVIYKQKVVDPYPREALQAFQPQPDQKEFKKGMCDCCSDMHLCLHATCCWPVRAAHTWEVMGIADYWIAVVASVCCPMLVWCIGGCLWRGKLREKFGIESSMLNDWCMWLWCTPCVVGQEAMQVDDVSSVKVNCCCNLVIPSEGSEPLIPGTAAESNAPTNNDTATEGNEADNEPAP